MSVVVLSQVEIWDELGWIIAKGRVPPEQASQALNAALMSRSATVAATDNGSQHIEFPAPPTAVSCSVMADRRPVNGDKGSVTFKFRLVRPGKPCPSQRHDENVIDPNLMGPKATQGQTVTSVSREVSEITGNHRRSADDDSCLSQQQVTAAARLGTTSMTNGPKRPNTAGVTIFDEIDDLLGFSPRGSGGCGSATASSLSVTAATSSGDGSGCFPAALGEGLLGTGAAVDDPLNESWSSAEEGQDFNSVAIGYASKKGSTEISPEAENLDQISETAAGARAENPRRIVESGGVLRANGPIAGSPTLPDTQIGAPDADTPSTVADIGSRQGLAANVSSAETHLDLTFQPPNNRINSPSVNSNDYSSYSDDDDEFEEDDDTDDENEARAPGARSLFSFSSVSSAPSIHDNFDGLDVVGGSEDGEQARVEVVMTAVAVRLRQRLRKAAEKCGSGSSDGGNAIEAGAALLFKRLDEVRLTDPFPRWTEYHSTHCLRRSVSHKIVFHKFICVSNNLCDRRRIDRNRLAPCQAYSAITV